MDNLKSVKGRRTQSWLGFSKRQSHVLETRYSSGISLLIVSGTLQGLPYPTVQIQSDTGLSTKLLNSVLLGSISSSQVYQFPVPFKFLFLTVPMWIFTETCPIQSTQVAAEPQVHRACWASPTEQRLARNLTLHLQLSDITVTVLLGIKIGKNYNLINTVTKYSWDIYRLLSWYLWRHLAFFSRNRVFQVNKSPLHIFIQVLGGKEINDKNLKYCHLPGR